MNPPNLDGGQHTRFDPRLARPRAAGTIPDSINLQQGHLVEEGTAFVIDREKLRALMDEAGVRGDGIGLYHGAFGFTGGWRRFVVHGRGAALRAQLALLALATVLIVPVLVFAGDAGLSGALAPVGVSLLIGAFLFGFGMQLGGGCGSGTLFTVGAGNIRMMLTLVFLIVGSVIGTLHLPWWLERPGFDPVNLAGGLGAGGAIALTLALCGGLAWWVSRIERRRHGEVERRLLAGHPWGITFAFGLWGAKLLQAVGVDMSQFEFWTWDYPAMALADSVLVNVTSVTNFGLLVGAMLAAGLAGRFNRASQGRIPPRSPLAAARGTAAPGSFRSIPPVADSHRDSVGRASARHSQATDLSG